MNLYFQSECLLFMLVVSMPVSDQQDDTFGTNENQKQGPTNQSFVRDIGLAPGEEHALLVSRPHEFSKFSKYEYHTTTIESRTNHGHVPCMPQACY